MTRTPISLLKEARANRLQLEVQPDGLHVRPREACPKAFQTMLRDHKAELIALLKLPFVMEFFRALNEMVFFCADEATKRALIELGADEWTIYTKAELEILVAQNRIAPLSLEELARLHEIKKTLGAKNTHTPNTEDKWMTSLSRSQGGLSGTSPPFFP